jgi:hypoxanthine phosphoribosyltransferase
MCLQKQSQSIVILDSVVGKEYFLLLMNLNLLFMSKKNYSKYDYYSWEQLERDIKLLANLITKDNQPDVVICISTGGWIPGRLLKNYLNASFFSIGCLAYNEDGNFSGKIRLTQSFGSEIDLQDKNILILDEVCETGGTLKMVTEYIRTFGPSRICTAVLHLKENAHYKADYYVHLVSDKWIIYPWSKV